MYELIKPTENEYFIQSPAKIGIIRSGDAAVLIDSGNDKDAGKRALRTLTSEGLSLLSVYNTHSHADHIGGNKYISSALGIDIFAPRGECPFIENTLLEPSLLYGANPPKELRHKFLMAEPSLATPLPDILEFGIEAIALPGHSVSMVGFRTKNDVVYIADALSSPQTLDKYKIGYVYDVGAYLETLRSLKSMKASLFIPSHAEPCRDIAPLAQYNIDAVVRVASDILEICKEKVTFDEIFAKIFAGYGLTPSIEQYALVGSTLRSYITYLIGEGRLVFGFSGNSMTYLRT